MDSNTLPDGITFDLGAMPAGDDVVEIVIDLSQPVTVSSLRLALSRAGSRDFADQVLAAAGDGMQRTFPRPSKEP